MGHPAPVPDYGGLARRLLPQSLSGAASTMGLALAFLLLPGSSLLIAGLWLGSRTGDGLLLRPQPRREANPDCPLATSGQFPQHQKK